MVVQIYERKLIYEGMDDLIDKNTSENVEVKWLIGTTIEILSEKDEEIDIQAIYDYGTNSNKGYIKSSSSDSEKESELRRYIDNNVEDIKMLIKAVKKLDKKIKEKE